MWESPDRPTSGEATQTPGLIILTGASHTGKTSVGEELLSILKPPTASLGVDQVLTATLARPPGAIWEQIPLAYDLMHLQLECLLDHGWLVVLESTFTYVPERGEPAFHGDALLRMIESARKRQLPWILCQLHADESVVLARARKSRRLGVDIVDQTLKLHEVAGLPQAALRVDTTNSLPTQSAKLIYELFRGLLPTARGS